MQVTATDAKNRFGYYCSQAKIEPVVIEKDGRPDTVLIDFAEYQALKSAARRQSLEQRKKEFEEKYREWFEWQNRQIEERGLWCEGIVGWDERT
ncbi:type II toxin-antitoxin system Phd/YefM family antitoxin [Ramlibacter sp. AW1]|uniref:Antitoxin n=1 Tax=Ramlibacter aurantiacus TaxID=2801330 RepID=A0A936ZPC0_9BURK|nr:type II toxin-antitoxin system prevent-host-death family antitoxin [Ramlibacter aurantiacus]MBL0420993.1 type II toxin-antitoxin system Phd/YefM family antitoxin [Ramlibacter aurantiacus]